MVGGSSGCGLCPWSKVTAYGTLMYGGLNIILDSMLSIGAFQKEAILFYAGSPCELGCKINNEFSS